MANDPATDPAHELLDHPQDSEVREPRVRLGTFLSLLRILAGRRGHASVRWSGAGFRYTVTVRRVEDADPVELDDDASAWSRAEVRARLLDALDG